MRLRCAKRRASLHVAANVAVLLAVTLLLGPAPRWVAAADDGEGPVVKQADLHAAVHAAAHGLAAAGQQQAADDVAGPVVKLPVLAGQPRSTPDNDNEDGGVVTVAEQMERQVHETAKTVAKAVDKALVQVRAWTGMHAWRVAWRLLACKRGTHDASMDIHIRGMSRPAGNQAPSYALCCTAPSPRHARADLSATTHAHARTSVCLPGPLVPNTSGSAKPTQNHANAYRDHSQVP
jgi:hypothetical protein